MNTIKSNGTLKTVVRKWTLYELIKKHKDDVARYEKIVRGEMRQIILGIGGPDGTESVTHENIGGKPSRSQRVFL